MPKGSGRTPLGTIFKFDLIYGYFGGPQTESKLFNLNLVFKILYKPTNNWTYYGKSIDIVSYSEKLGIWIF